MKFKLFLMIIVLAVTGCAKRNLIPVKPTLTANPPKFVNLVSSNITIKAKNGSWEISPNKAFKPSKSFKVHDVKDKPVSVTDITSNLNSYKNAWFKNSIMDVTVKVAGGQRLKGKMVFFNVLDNSVSSSAKRMWTVSVPKSYIDTAKSGNIAVLYQPYEVAAQRLYTTGPDARKKMRVLLANYNLLAQGGAEKVSWVLWMSKLPL